MSRASRCCKASERSVDALPCSAVAVAVAVAVVGFTLPLPPRDMTWHNMT